MGLPHVGRIREIKKQALEAEQREDHKAKAKATAKAGDSEILNPYAVPADRKVEVDVGAMKVTVTPGPDETFGTPDDKVVIKPKKAKKAKKAAPLFDKKSTVADLKALAAKNGIEVSSKAKKAEILTLLEKHLA
jgi:hypothetical protein